MPSQTTDPTNAQLALTTLYLDESLRAISDSVSKVIEVQNLHSRMFERIQASLERQEAFNERTQSFMQHQEAFNERTQSFMQHQEAFNARIQSFIQHQEAFNERTQGFMQHQEAFNKRQEAVNERQDAFNAAIESKVATVISKLDIVLSRLPEK